MWYQLRVSFTGQASGIAAVQAQKRDIRQAWLCHHHHWQAFSCLLTLHRWCHLPGKGHHLCLPAPAQLQETQLPLNTLPVADQQGGNHCSRKVPSNVCTDCTALRGRWVTLFHPQSASNKITWELIYQVNFWSMYTSYLRQLVLIISRIKDLWTQGVFSALFSVRNSHFSWQSSAELQHKQWTISKNKYCLVNALRYAQSWLREE